MKPLAVVAAHRSESSFEKTLLSLINSNLVEQIAVVSHEPVRLKTNNCDVLIGFFSSHETLSRILDGLRTRYLLLLPGKQCLSMEPEALDKLVTVAETTQAGLVFSDFFEKSVHGKILHPLNDYQPGSVRDNFDFGAMLLFSVPAIRKALKTYGILPKVKFAGPYDLRLKVSIDHSVNHLREPLYSVIQTDEPVCNDKLFAYVDPRNQAVQKEMEAVFTNYLKQIGAYLSPHQLREVTPTTESYPVEASVVIPVRNRKETISEAAKSALSQETDFPFNVIVVDNHSKDGTTAILSDLARRHSNLKHIVPKRTDLGIGGCWNEAIQSEACGRYAAQLDSDDLYSTCHTLQRMIDTLRKDRYAMVIGSYTLVDFELREMPPGLINHREWTDENGHNNALRINGLGAPRAFDTDFMRNIGFLNVSYGEDYAAALRICRQYRIGRIYENLYLCRRWSGNTDAALSLEDANRNDAFKDKIRSDEILARQRIAEGIVHRA